MDNELSIVTDAPGLLVVRRSRAMMLGTYISAAIVFLGMGSVSDLGIVLIPAAAGIILVNLYRLSFALWTTATFRAGADRIEARIWGLVFGDTQFLDPQRLRVSVSRGEVVWGRNEGADPMPFCKIDLIGGTDDPGHVPSLGRAKPDLATQIVFRLSELLAQPEEPATAPPAP